MKCGLLKVYHASDFITKLGKMGCPSILLNASLVGRFTVGVLLIECDNGTMNNRAGILKDLASTYSIVKEFELIDRSNNSLAFYIKKVSFGTQKAIVETGAIRVLPIVHDIDGYKKFYIVYREASRNKLVELTKRYAIKAGEKVVHVKILEIRQQRPTLITFHEISLLRQTSITPAEYFALKKALELGYFEWPRRCSLKEVSNSLGLSEAAVLEHIRRGTKKLVSWYTNTVNKTLY